MDHESRGRRERRIKPSVRFESGGSSADRLSITLVKEARGWPRVTRRPLRVHGKLWLHAGRIRTRKHGPNLIVSRPVLQTSGACATVREHGAEDARLKSHCGLLMNFSCMSRGRFFFFFGKVAETLGGVRWQGNSEDWRVEYFGSVRRSCMGKKDFLYFIFLCYRDTNGNIFVSFVRLKSILFCCTVVL